MTACRALAPDPAFTVATLAQRWQCGKSTVRKLIDRDELAAFRLGTALRISAAEVERFECQATQCNASGEDSPLSGEKTASDDDEPSTPQIDRARNPKRAGFGRQATVHRGPWAD